MKTRTINAVLWGIMFGLVVVALDFSFSTSQTVEELREAVNRRDTVIMRQNRLLDKMDSLNEESFKLLYKAIFDNED